MTDHLKQNLFKFLNRRWWWLVGILLVANFYIGWRSRVIPELLTAAQPMWDFDVYWQTAGDVWRGAHPYHLAYMETLGPPLVIAPFLPLSLLPLVWGRRIMIGLGLMAGFSSCWVLAGWCVGQMKVKTPWVRWVLSLEFSAVLFSAFPTRFTFILGQFNLVLMWLLTLYLTSKDHKKRGWSLGVATVLKTFVGFNVLAHLNWKKNQQVVSGFLLSLMAIFIISLPVLKWKFYQDYFTQRFARIVLSTNQAPNLDYYNQSLKATLQRLGVGEIYPMVFIGLLVVAALYLIFNQNYLAGICLSLLLSPVAWQHYFVLIWPVLVISGGNFIKERKWLKLSWWLIALSLWWLEFPWLHTQPMTLMTGLLASHYFVSNVVLLGLTL